MPEKCGKCDKVLSESDIMGKCVDCKLSFHATCTRAGSTQSFTKSKNKSLKCDSCVEESKSNISVRSNDDKETILEAIRAMKVDINKNTDEKINSVLESVSSLQEDFKKLQEGVTRLDSEQGMLRERCSKLEQANGELQDEVFDLEMRLHDAEQHSRAANIEIVGLPMTQGEDIYKCLQQVARVVGVTWGEGDFSIAHRLQRFSRKRHSHPPIIAQFSSRRTKETWMRAVRAKKSLNAIDIHPSLPPSNIYINDQMTPHNKALLWRARQLRKEGRIVFAGFYNGKVLVKQCEGAETVRVVALSDLDKFDSKK